MPYISITIPIQDLRRIETCVRYTITRLKSEPETPPYIVGDYERLLENIEDMILKQ